MSNAFRERGVTDPRRSAEVLLEHVIKMERIRLYAHADRPASPDELAELRALAQRALHLEPVQYLVGEWWFFGLPYYVDKRVLIPRPSTETLVEEILQGLKRSGRSDQELLIADVGTGSGCIACALLKGLPNARAIAIDISVDAIDVARSNVERHSLSDRVVLIQGNLCDPLPGHEWVTQRGGVDVLASNPPYIPDAEWDAPDQVGEDVRKWEPTGALRGGTDGLDLVRPLIENGRKLLRSGGIFAVEIAASTAHEALDLFEATGDFEQARTIRDLEGHDRVVVGTK